MNFIVLCSSRGTTFQAVIDRIEDGALKADCIGLIADRPDRGCIEKAKAADIPVQIVEKKTAESREEYELCLDEAILKLSTAAPESQTVLAAMGWMWILTPDFVKRHKIVNVHPALLPKYGGAGMYGRHVHEAVIKNNEIESGITIHFMDDGVDTGHVILQKTIPVIPGDSPENLQARVQELEKKWYPEVLQMIEEGKIKL